jgi:AcrR family transcriptional regulator
MSMSSRPGREARRVPQQKRGEKRVQTLLDAAAAVIASSGYESATMSAIAVRAHASIGSLYQFFPSKESIAQALREQYCKELCTLWTSSEGATHVSIDELVRSLILEMTAYLDARPALLPLFNASSASHDTSIRDLLRERLARILRYHAPSLSKSRAILLATIILQVMKGMNELYTEAAKPQRKPLAREYACVLNCYLNAQVPATVEAVNCRNLYSKSI